MYPNTAEISTPAGIRMNLTSIISSRYVTQQEITTPLIEITLMGDSLPFSVIVSLDRIKAMHTYREPQLQNYGSEKRYKCTHKGMPLVYFSPSEYRLSTVTEEPIGSVEMHGCLALRYQMNPYKIPKLKPRRNSDVIVYESTYLRKVFVEAVPLCRDSDNFENWSAYALHGPCGVNLYTYTEGVFSAPGVKVPIGGLSDSNNSLVLIYSSIPNIRNKIQKHFSADSSSPSLIVDDVFVEWGSLGWMSLNELHDMGALYLEDNYDDVFDFVVNIKD